MTNSNPWAANIAAMDPTTRYLFGDVNNAYCVSCPGMFWITRYQQEYLGPPPHTASYCPLCNPAIFLKPGMRNWRVHTYLRYLK